MLITQREEISAYLPTSVDVTPESLLLLTEDAEENYLVPVLGRNLYNKVGEIYEEVIGQHGNILPASIPKSEETPEIRLVRLCQMPVLYFALANSTGLLSVNLNESGFNQSSTEGYDAADLKSVERFERDAYFKARRGIDRLLIFLEEDARSDSPLFADLWKESIYFYQQGDLLLTTATEMNRFLNIDSSREKFIALLPDLRYCQDTYLTPAIGDELMEVLIRSCTDSSVLPLPAKPASVWRKAVNYLRMALAIYVENRRPEKQRRYSENEASMSLSRAKQYISDHQDDFGEWITNSPLYTPTRKTDGTEKEVPKFDFDDPTNAVSFPFGMGLNRH